jgi:hypothetical protein
MRPLLTLSLLSGCWLPEAAITRKLDTTPPSEDSEPADSPALTESDEPIDSEPLPVCPDAELPTGTASPLATGDNTLEDDDHDPSCSERVGGRDTSLGWRSDRAGCYVFSLLGSTYDTVLSVLDQCDGVELACNDDALKEQRAFTSEVHLTLDADQPLVLVVDAWNAGQTGAWSLHVTAGEQPALDGDLGDAEGELIAGNNRLADDTLSEHGCAPSGADRLYTWTAPRRGAWTFTNLGTEFDAVLSVHRLCAPLAIACSDAELDGAEEVSITLDAGETVVIRLAGYAFTPLTPAIGDFALQARHSP